MSIVTRLYGWSRGKPDALPCTHGVQHHLHMDIPGGDYRTVVTCASCGQEMPRKSLGFYLEGN